MSRKFAARVKAAKLTKIKPAQKPARRIESKTLNIRGGVLSYRFHPSHPTPSGGVNSASTSRPNPCSRDFHSKIPDGIVPLYEAGLNYHSSLALHRVGESNEQGGEGDLLEAARCTAPCPGFGEVCAVARRGLASLRCGICLRGFGGGIL